MMRMISPTQIENDSQMATPGELVRVLAGVLGVPEATLVVHDRNLLGAGLRSKKGRGRGAPSVTARDLAHLLTAVLGSAQVKDSVATVRRYSGTRPYAARSSEKLFTELGIEELVALPRQHSFVDALEALIIASSAGSIAKNLRAKAVPRIEVAALSPGTSADIRIDGLRKGVTAAVNYVQPGAAERAHRARTDLEQHRRISAKTILSAAEALITVEEDR